jgi:hypothetical protein
MTNFTPSVGNAGVDGNPSFFSTLHKICITFSSDSLAELKLVNHG